MHPSRIALTVPEVAGTEDWVTSYYLPFLLDLSSISKIQPLPLMTHSHVVSSSHNKTSADFLRIGERLDAQFLLENYLLNSFSQLDMSKTFL